MKRLLIAMLALSGLTVPLSAWESTDVVVYGATPGGIAAALGAAKDGKSVLLIESGSEIGGLLTSGLSHTDFHSFESLTGTFLHFSQRVRAYYLKTYGEGSEQVKASFRGTFGEPKVNLLVLQEMLGESPGIRVEKNARLESVQTVERRIQRAVFVLPDGTKQTSEARIWVDGTYEGDLMAAAGVAYHVGREGRDVTGESFAPPTGDSQLQAYNFRFILTQDPENLLPPPAPEGYRREDFVGVLPVLASGRIDHVFGYPSRCLFKAQTPPLPNGKYDINDVSREMVRLSLPGANLGWPEGDIETRRRIFQEHLRDQLGLFYFLRNDPEVPDKFRTEARTWGFAKDEFPDTGGLPRELYVREARRMTGVRVYSQQDSERAEGDVRAVFHADSIASADYGNNCHGTFREGNRWKGRHTGEFYNPVPPYQIPYGVLLPKTLDNLLVPVAVSATHVGFCALRLEPVWMSLGQAAGHAAALALEENVPLHKIDVSKLQSQLHTDGSATIYVSDVPPGDPDFAAVQAWGALGGLHGLVAWKEGIKPRGAGIHGQYSQAAPEHEAKLDAPLTAELKTRWVELANKSGIDSERVVKAQAASTRGEFIRAVHGD